MDILLLTDAPAPVSARPLFAVLDLLTHAWQVGDLAALPSPPQADVVMVDARRRLAGARDACRLLYAAAVRTPLIAVVDAGGLIAVAPDWHVDDVLLADAGPAEWEARLRLVVGRAAGLSDQLPDGLIRVGDLIVDPDTYSVRLRGRSLDLSYKEFELLRFLAAHPNQVFSRDRLLRELWGYDYVGGHRTVDMHVRRLRAKLGSSHDTLIGTVRNVGYKLACPSGMYVPEPAGTSSRQPV
jgi:DNA-binding response OmpR family regulator